MSYHEYNLDKLAELLKYCEQGFSIKYVVNYYGDQAAVAYMDDGTFWPSVLHLNPIPDVRYAKKFDNSCFWNKSIVESLIVETIEEEKRNIRHAIGEKTWHVVN